MRIGPSLARARTLVKVGSYGRRSPRIRRRPTRRRPSRRVWWPLTSRAPRRSLGIPRSVVRDRWFPTRKGPRCEGEPDRFLEPGEPFLGCRSVEDGFRLHATMGRPAVGSRRTGVGHRSRSRATTIASRASMSAWSCGRPARRLSRIRSAIDAIRVRELARSTSSDPCQSSSKSIGFSTKTSTERRGSSGSHNENTFMSRSTIHRARTAGSANPEASTGSRGRRPSPTSASIAMVASRGERSTAMSRSAVSLACP